MEEENANSSKEDLLSIALEMRGSFHFSQEVSIGLPTASPGHLTLLQRP